MNIYTGSGMRLFIRSFMYAIQGSALVLALLVATRLDAATIATGAFPADRQTSAALPHSDTTLQPAPGNASGNFMANRTGTGPVSCKDASGYRYDPLARLEWCADAPLAPQRQTRPGMLGPLAILSLLAMILNTQWAAHRRNRRRSNDR